MDKSGFLVVTDDGFWGGLSECDGDKTSGFLAVLVDRTGALLTERNGAFLSVKTDGFVGGFLATLVDRTGALLAKRRGVFLVIKMDGFLAGDGFSECDGDKMSDFFAALVNSRPGFWVGRSGGFMAVMSDGFLAVMSDGFLAVMGDGFLAVMGDGFLLMKSGGSSFKSEELQTKLYRHCCTPHQESPFSLVEAIQWKGVDFHILDPQVCISM